MKTGVRKRRRVQRPQDGRAYHQPEASLYAHDLELSDPLFLVRQVRALPEVRDELLAETTPPYAGGRRRREGHYALLYLAFLCSDIIDVKTWCERWRDSPVWELCGFEERPNYRSVWLRFVELERYAAAFERAAQKLIRRARRHEPRIGRYLHVDATHFTTHAQLVHCCPDEAECARRWKRGPGPRPKRS
jgi:hypothetical protein